MGLNAPCPIKMRPNTWISKWEKK